MGIFKNFDKKGRDSVARKIRNVFIVILSLILLAAIGLFALAEIAEGMRTTETYEKAERICKRVERGRSYTKKEIFEKFGYPHYYADKSDEAVFFSHAEKENYENALFDKDTVEWVYEGHRYIDPADPYRLFVYFDESGKTVRVEMKFLPGG